MTVTIEERGPVTIVTIDRPDVRNAVDGPTAAELVEAFEAFASREDQRVAVLTGAAGTFCSGADLKALANDPARANRVEPEGPGPMGPTRMTLDKPVLAAIEGYAVAGGLELALWCDLRIAGDDAALGFFDRRWGVPLIDGGTIRLPRLIGHSRAMDLLLTGRAVHAREAHEMGLVNRVVPQGTALEASVALADEIARFPQTCMVSDRASAVGQWGLDLTAAMQREFELGVTTIASGETRSGAERFAGGLGRHGNFSDI